MKNMKNVLRANDSDSEPEDENYDEVTEIQPFSEMIVISHDNKFYAAWLSFETVCCLVSSYVYGFFATFYTWNRHP